MDIVKWISYKNLFAFVIALFMIPKNFLLRRMNNKIRLYSHKIINSEIIVLATVFT